MARLKVTKEQEKRIVDSYKSGVSARKIAKYYGWYPQVVYNSLRRSGIEIDKTRRDPRKGDKNGNWKGGTRTIGGYKHILRPGHKLARKDGWVLIHRIVAEKKINRELKKGEVVHHIDENTLNNAPDNLEVYKGNGHHIINNHVNGRTKIGRFR